MLNKNLRVSDLDNTHMVYEHQYATSPSISVIMPVYSLRNGKTEKAILSVLNQTLDNIELILIDDGSLDGTEHLCKSFFKQDKRVKYIRFEKNSGLPALRVNQGIEHSSAQYIAYMFEDDYMLPGAYEELLNFIEERKVSFVFGKALVVDGENDSLDEVNRDDVIVILGDKDIGYVDLLESNKIANSSVLHRRDLFEDIGLYDPSILARRLSDWDLWLRISKKYSLNFCDVDVAIVSINDPYSLGKNVPLDYVETVEYMNTERNNHLKVDNYYSFNIGNSSLVKGWLYKHPLILDKENQFSVRYPYVAKPIVTKGHYDTTIDVTVNSFKNYLGDFTFIPDSMLMSVDSNKDLLLHRTLNPSLTGFIEHKQKLGSASTYFIDDNLFRFAEGSYSAKFPYLKPGEEMYEALEKQVALADTVVSYSEDITYHCKKYNDNVIERPTVIDSKYLEGVELNRINEVEPVKICLMSSSFREKEMEVIWEQLVRLSKKYLDKMEFHFMGVKLEDKYLNLLSSKFYLYDFTYSYHDYMSSLKAINPNIVISPLLDDHPTKRSKSPIKYLEATASGAIFVASDVQAYKDIPNTCYIKVKDDDWYRQLDTLLQADKLAFEKIFDCAFKNVTKHYSSDSQVVGFSNIFLLSKINRLLDDLSLERNVSFVFHESFRGGATVYLIRLAQILKSLNFNVSLVFPKSPNNSDATFEYLKYSGLDQIEILQYNPTIEPINQSDEEAIKDFKGYFKKNKTGLVFCVTYITDAIAAANKLAIPSIASLFATESERFDFEFSKPSMIISDSNRYGEIWSKLVGVPFSIICQKVKPAYFNIDRSNTCLGRDTINIISSGTIQERKGQYEIIVACAALIRRGYDIKLALLGYNNLVPDYVEKCEKFIADNKLSERIRLVGFVENPEHYHREADIYVCASSYESLPGALLQAMASNNFTITSTAGGIGEIIKNGFNGFILNSINSEEIEKAILKAIKLEPKDRCSILANAKETAFLLASTDYVESDLLYTIYETLKNSNSGASRLQGLKEVKSSYFGKQQIKSIKEAPSLINISGLLPSRRLPCEVKVRPNISTFSKLSIFIATGGMENDISELELKIMSSNFTIREVTKKITRQQDNSLISFEFESVKVKDSPNLNISLSSKEGCKLALYGSPRAIKIFSGQPYIIFE